MFLLKDAAPFYIIEKSPRSSAAPSSVLSMVVTGDVSQAPLFLLKDAASQNMFYIIEKSPRSSAPSSVWSLVAAFDVCQAPMFSLKDAASQNVFYMSPRSSAPSSVWSLVVTFDTSQPPVFSLVAAFDVCQAPMFSLKDAASQNVFYIIEVSRPPSVTATGMDQSDAPSRRHRVLGDCLTNRRGMFKNGTLRSTASSDG